MKGSVAFIKKNKFISLISILSISILVCFPGLYWFVISTALFVTIYILINRTIKNNYFNIFFNLLYIIIIAIALRVFVFEVYNIPSSSMEDALFIGDNVIANKLFYGPKLPQSPFEISWGNLFFYRNDKDVGANPVNWKYKRLTGASNIKRNDIIIFSIPHSQTEVLIKRCVGLPGESLKITNGEVTINGKSIVNPNQVKHLYEIWVTNQNLFINAANSLNINYQVKCASNKEQITAYLNSDNLSKLKLLNVIDSISSVKAIKTSAFSRNKLNWTIDNFGPIFIPSAGTTIHLTKEIFLLYSNTIARNENVFIYMKNNSFYLNEKEIFSYTFKNNYYFMLGDNRNNSNDSRFWGFIPEQDIIARATTILFSYKNNAKFDWSRLLKKL